MIQSVPYTACLENSHCAGWGLQEEKSALVAKAKADLSAAAAAYGALAEEKAGVEDTLAEAVAGREAGEKLAAELGAQVAQLQAAAAAQQDYQQQIEGTSSHVPEP